MLKNQVITPKNHINKIFIKLNSDLKMLFIKFYFGSKDDFVNIYNKKYPSSDPKFIISTIFDFDIHLP